MPDSLHVNHAPVTCMCSKWYSRTQRALTQCILFPRGLAHIHCFLCSSAFYFWSRFSHQAASSHRLNLRSAATMQHGRRGCPPVRREKRFTFTLLHFSVPEKLIFQACHDPTAFFTSGLNNHTHKYYNYIWEKVWLLRLALFFVPLCVWCYTVWRGINCYFFYSFINALFSYSPFSKQCIILKQMRK